MADGAIKELALNPTQKVQEAKDLLAIEAVQYMQRGYPLEKGQGAASVDKAGELNIVGLNKDRSIIHWTSDVSATQKGSWPNIEFETKNVNPATSKVIVEKEEVDFKSRDSKLEISGIDEKGAKEWSMSGSCSITDDGGKECDFKIADGTAHIKDTLNADGDSNINISVKTSKVDRSVDVVFKTNEEVATYSYELSKK